MPVDRFTLAAITAAAVLAATLATTMIPAAPITPNPALTWAIVYLGAVFGLAKAAHLPPARTLCAATLLVTQALLMALVGLRYAVDGLILALAATRQAGAQVLTAPHHKEAWTA